MIIIIIFAVLMPISLKSCSCRWIASANRSNLLCQQPSTSWLGLVSPRHINAEFGKLGLKSELKLSLESRPTPFFKKGEKRKAPTSLLPPQWNHVGPSPPVGLGLSHYHAMLQNGLELKPFPASRSLVKGAVSHSVVWRMGWGDGGGGVWPSGQRIGFSGMLSSIQFPLDREPLLHCCGQGPFSSIVLVIQANEDS